jgi:hypothetical protein
MASNDDKAKAAAKVGKDRRQAVSERGARQQELARANAAQRRAAAKRHPTAGLD